MAQRNGYRDRDWHARAGTVALRIPQLRPRASCRRALLRNRMIRVLADHGLVLSRLPGAPANGRAGADGGDPSRASRPRGLPRRDPQRIDATDVKVRQTGRIVADRLHPKLPQRAVLMHDAGADMTFLPRRRAKLHRTNPSNGSTTR